MSRTSRVTVQSPAKINLALAVGSPRSDGYHPLATVYQAVSLFDRVTAEPAEDSGIVLEMTDAGHGAPPLDGVPTDERNLAVRAARLLAEHTGTRTGTRLRLRKQIPVAAGLAGGSSDAAAALVACDALWGTGLSAQALSELGAELGSDVPFCLLGRTAVGDGRGEHVSRVPARGTFHWVAAVADSGLSTPAVYAELDRLRTYDGGDGIGAVADLEVPDALLAALRAADPRAVGASLANDLQPAAVSLRPELAEVLDLRPLVGAHGAVVSGSGPTCLFLADGEWHAHQIRRSLRRAGVSTVLQFVGPVAGAHVVETTRADTTEADTRAGR